MDAQEEKLAKEVVDLTNKLNAAVRSAKLAGLDVFVFEHAEMDDKTGDVTQIVSASVSKTLASNSWSKR